MIFIVVKAVTSGENATVMTYSSVHMGIVTLFLLFSVSLSYVNEKFAELIGLSIIVPNAIIILLSFTTEILSMNTTSRDF